MFKTSLRKQNLKIVNINRDIPRETLLTFSYLYKRKNCSVPPLPILEKNAGNTCDFILNLNTLIMLRS